MRVAVLCERSGIVRDAFIRRGHEAVSCDLETTRAPGPHIQGDCFAQDWSGFDLIIAHPECTYLTVANTYMKRGCSKYTAEQAIGLREQAVAFFMRCVELCKRIGRGCIENPVGVMSTLYRKPNQIIQPWQFGEDASKKTCLWLEGLTPLVPTLILPGGKAARRQGAQTKLRVDRIGSDPAITGKSSGRTHTQASRRRWRLSGAMVNE